VFVGGLPPDIDEGMLAKGVHTIAPYKGEPSAYPNERTVGTLGTSARPDNI